MKLFNKLKGKKDDDSKNKSQQLQPAPEQLPPQSQVQTKATPQSTKLPLQAEERKDTINFDDLLNEKSQADTLGLGNRHGNTLETQRRQAIVATRGNRAGTNAFMEEMLSMNDLGDD